MQSEQPASEMVPPCAGFPAHWPDPLPVFPHFHSKSPGWSGSLRIFYAVCVFCTAASAALDLAGPGVCLFGFRTHRLLRPPHGCLPIRNRRTAGIHPLYCGDSSAMFPQRSAFKYSGYLFSCGSAALGKSGGRLCLVPLLFPAPGPHSVFSGTCRGETSTYFKINLAAPGHPGTAHFYQFFFRNCYPQFMNCLRNNDMLSL